MEKQKTEIFGKIKENKLEIVIFLMILATGFFFRTYHFSDWLHFEIDQTFDITAVAPAVENSIGNLPLLGPVAAGGPLRLGPAFYYLEYISAKIFGNTPSGHAVSVLFFSIASLVIFYFFCKIYFNRTTSLGLLALFVSSLYLVLYSRFSWNPNILPFFVLFSFYALLKSFSAKESKKEVWFFIMSGFVAIATQLHFNALLIVPPIIIFFLIINKPQLKLKTWLHSFLIFLVIYSPFIINDIKTGGENFGYLTKKFLDNSKNSDKSDVDSSNKKIIEKSFQIVRYDIYEYFLILTGSDQINSSRPKGYSLGLSCDSCKENIPWRLGAILFFVSGIILFVKNILTEKEVQKKYFLQIILLWFVFSSLYFIVITYKGLYIYPRFFLIVSPLPFIFLGFLIKKISDYRHKFSFFLFVAIISVISAFNIAKIFNYFNQLKNTSIKSNEVETEDVFPNNYRITLEQQNKIMNYIKSKYDNNGYPIYIKSESEYEPAFWYHLEKSGIKLYDNLNESAIYKEGNYFLILRTAQKNQQILLNYEKNFILLDQINFGTLFVQNIIPGEDKITAIRQDFSNIRRSFQPIKSPYILTWGDVF